MRGPRAFLAVLVLAGCQPLYGGKVESMKGPPKTTAPEDEEVAIKWNEECDTKFHEKLTIPPNVNAGRTLTESATNTLVDAERSEDAGQRSALTVQAIEKFKQALNKDPFSAEATYGLAIAYTKVQYKGCTLKLLKRLADLKQNPKYAPDAQRMIDQAADQNAFRPFKKDAHAALGI